MIIEKKSITKQKQVRGYYRNVHHYRSVENWRERKGKKNTDKASKENIFLCLFPNHEQNKTYVALLAKLVDPVAALLLDDDNDVETIIIFFSYQIINIIIIVYQIPIEEKKTDFLLLLLLVFFLYFFFKFLPSRKKRSRYEKIELCILV
jgi:hypothetical protein